MTLNDRWNTVGNIRQHRLKPFRADNREYRGKSPQTSIFAILQFLAEPQDALIKTDKNHPRESPEIHSKLLAKSCERSLSEVFDPVTTDTADSENTDKGRLEEICGGEDQLISPQRDARQN